MSLWRVVRSHFHLVVADRQNTFVLTPTDFADAIDLACKECNNSTFGSKVDGALQARGTHVRPVHRLGAGRGVERASDSCWRDGSSRRWAARRNCRAPSAAARTCFSRPVMPLVQKSHAASSGPQSAMAIGDAAASSAHWLPGATTTLRSAATVPAHDCTSSTCSSSVTTTAEPLCSRM
jgi:hypothetical protein